MKEKNEKNQEGYSLVSNSANTVETLEFGRKFRNVEGMGWVVTCLFIVGETAGGGLIAMPTAMLSAGLAGGIIVILVGALMCAFTGYQLSENWTILQERWPEYRNHCRKPYPAMGLRAIGPRFMTIVSAVLNATMFGTAVVFLLLAAKNIENFLHAYAGVHVGFCYLVLIVALFMFPFTLLKSPKDFWWAVIGAMMTTSMAVSLIIYGSVLDAPVCLKEVRYPEIVPSKFFMCFGTVMFAYGGHGAFPTIQHDMKKPYQFRRSVFAAFLIIFLMYLPVSITGYLTYGDSLRDSIIPSLQEFFVQQTVNILITLHVVLALTIVFNPLNQELEDLLNIPHEMGVQRVMARGAMMLAVVFVAETVPNFGVLLDLVGGSTITLMALVFPALFNLYLTAGRSKHNNAMATPDEKPCSIREVLHYTSWACLLANGVVLAFAFIGGTAATVSAMNIMLGSEFSAPCYAQIFFSGDMANTEDLSANISGNVTLSHAIFNKRHLLYMDESSPIWKSRIALLMYGITIAFHTIATIMFGHLSYCVFLKRDRLRIQSVSSSMRLFLGAQSLFGALSLPHFIYTLAMWGTEGTMTRAYILYWSGIFSLNYLTIGPLLVSILTLERCLTLHKPVSFEKWRYFFGVCSGIAVLLVSCFVVGIELLELPIEVSTAVNCASFACINRRFRTIPQLYLRLAFCSVDCALSIFFLRTLSRRRGNRENFKNRLVKMTVILELFLEVIPTYINQLISVVSGRPAAYYLGPNLSVLYSIEMTIIAISYSRVFIRTWFTSSQIGNQKCNLRQSAIRNAIDGNRITAFNRNPSLTPSIHQF